MDHWLQWAITAIIGILGILAGRVWERYDRKSKKDQDLINKMLGVVSVDNDDLLWFRKQDFGGKFDRNLIQPIRSLDVFLAQPGHSFLDKKLENIRLRLAHTIHDFMSIFVADVFTNDFNYQLLQLIRPHEKLEKWIGHMRDIGKMPSEQEEEAMMDKFTRKYDQTRDRLNSLANEICDAYDELVAYAHSRI